MKNTEIILHLAVTTPFSLATLKSIKANYNLTDFGLEECVIFACQRGLGLGFGVNVYLNALALAS